MSSSSGGQNKLSTQSSAALIIIVTPATVQWVLVGVAIAIRLSVRGYWGHYAGASGPPCSKRKRAPAIPRRLHRYTSGTGDGWGQVCRARSATNHIAAPTIWDLLFRAKSLLVVVRRFHAAASIAEMTVLDTYGGTYRKRPPANVDGAKFAERHEAATSTLPLCMKR
jgi:hypothetical protein